MPSDNGTTTDVGPAIVDAGADTDVSQATDTGGPIDTGVTVDAVSPATDVGVTTDNPVPTDAGPVDSGVIELLGVRGDFVGGGVAGSAGGITIQGQFSWHASVSGNNGGISLEGLLR